MPQKRAPRAYRGPKRPIQMDSGTEGHLHTSKIRREEHVSSI